MHGSEFKAYDAQFRLACEGLAACVHDSGLSVSGFMDLVPGMRNSGLGKSCCRTCGSEQSRDCLSGLKVLGSCLKV